MPYAFRKDRDRYLDRSYHRDLRRLVDIHGNILFDIGSNLEPDEPMYEQIEEHARDMLQALWMLPTIDDKRVTKRVRESVQRVEEYINHARTLEWDMGYRQSPIDCYCPECDASPGTRCSEEDRYGAIDVVPFHDLRVALAEEY